MEPITGLDKVSKQRWKLVGDNFYFAIADNLISKCHRNALFVVFAKVHVCNAPRPHASWHFMRHVRERRNS